MKNILATLAVALLCVSGCGDKAAPAVASLDPRYEATFAEGIDFRKPGFPRNVVEVRGMSDYEPWGRWTNHTATRFVFSEPLPLAFVLEITGGAVGPNLGKPVRVKVGTQTKEFAFTADPFNTQPQTQSLEFVSTNPVNTIELQTPQLWRPINGDPRELGIALVALRVIRN